MTTGKGGYDYDFVDGPPKSLECPVCLLTLRDPHVISCCGQEFCQLCIGRVERDGKPCPLCNEPTFTTLLHKKLIRKVNALVVRCPQKEVGCEWQGELGQLEQHLNPGAGVSSSGGCGYVMVECSYQCGAFLERRGVRDHEVDTCPKRPIEMQIAHLMNKFQAITAENKLLRQELSEVRDSHLKELNEVKQELVEVQKKNEQLVKDQKDMQVTCNEFQNKQKAMKVDFHETKVKQMTKIDALEKKCSSLHIHTTPLPVPPFYFSFLNVNLYQSNDCIIKSEPFYSHPGGYNMVVTIYPNGFGSSKGVYVSLGVIIQRGEFDDQLQWPFNGRITLQIYNLTRNKWSKEITIKLDDMECKRMHVSQCFDEQTCGSWVHKSLLISELKTHYITKDSYSVAKFRVTNVEILIP